ncbi:MAG: glycosyltransferase family 4 protein [Pseudomonadota bacterium]
MMGMPHNPIRIANISESADPNWCWVRDVLPNDLRIIGRPLKWTNFSAAPELAFPRGIFKKVSSRVKSLARLKAVLNLRQAHRKHPFDVIVSHYPVVSFWTSMFLSQQGARPRHLAASFNFTQLPSNLRRSIYSRFFSSIDNFFSYTSAEIDLYSRYFAIPSKKIIKAPWGVAPPSVDSLVVDKSESYFSAVGGEARDYSTLCGAARQLPHLKFKCVGRPQNFAGIDIPENVEVQFNVPLEQTWEIMARSKAAIVPLQSRETACGIVTVVSNMQLGKAQIVTETVGLSDYLSEGQTGLFVPPQDDHSLAQAIKRLDESPDFALGLGQAAKDFATKFCSEQATIDFFIERMENCLSEDRIND